MSFFFFFPFVFLPKGRPSGGVGGGKGQRLSAILTELTDPDASVLGPSEASLLEATIGRENGTCGVRD